MLRQPYADVEFIFVFVYIGVYLHDVKGVDHFNVCASHVVRFRWAMFSSSVIPVSSLHVLCPHTHFEL